MPQEQDLSIIQFQERSPYRNKWARRNTALFVSIINNELPDGDEFTLVNESIVRGLLTEAYDVVEDFSVSKRLDMSPPESVDVLRQFTFGVSTTVLANILKPRKKKIEVALFISRVGLGIAGRLACRSSPADGA